MTPKELKQRRTEAHCTQEELSEYSEIGQSYISKMESGQRTITPERAAKLEQGLRIAQEVHAMRLQSIKRCAARTTERPTVAAEIAASNAATMRHNARQIAQQMRKSA